MRKHYKAQKVCMAIAILAVVAMAVLNLAWKDGPEPDGCYPMANQHISWTYAKGAVQK